MSTSESHVTKSTKETPSINYKTIEEFETSLRQLKIELCLKRNEVTKLTTQLEETQHENYSLKGSLERLKAISDDNSITLDMFRKRNMDLEPKYYEKRDGFAKLEMQYKMEIVRNKTLKDECQHIAKEREKLMRNVEALEEKTKHHSLYINEISSKLGKFQNVATFIRDDLQNMKQDFLTVKSIPQSLNSLNEKVDKYQELSNIVDQLKKDKSILQEECIKLKTKCEKLESNFQICSPNVFETNFMAKTLLVRLEKMAEHYGNKMQTKNEIISILNASLQQEKQANVKLIQQFEKTCEENAALKAKIAGTVYPLYTEDIDRLVKKEITDDIVEVADSP